MEETLSLRRSVWISSLITFVGLAFFIGISALIPRPGNNTGVLVLSLFLALFPAVIWLGFFYQQDRSEPEPKRLVARMFAFGALAAAVFPITEQIANQTISQFPSLLVRLPLTILSVSLIQEVLKVSMVRYVVLGTNEFDRHPDGIVYGLASGLGFATILTVAFVLHSSGVIPLVGAIRAVNNVLVHGTLGAVSGYYIGRVKIDGKKLGWMVQGLVLVTVANGLYQTLSVELSNRLAFNPWYSLGVATVLAIGTGMVLFTFFRRALRRAAGDLQTVSIQAHARSKDMPWDIHIRYDFLLIGSLALALIIGWGAGIVQGIQTVDYTGDELPVEFSYPSRWVISTEGISGLSIHNLAGSGSFKPTISLTTSKTRAGSSLDFILAQYLAAYGQQTPLYTPLSQQDGLTVDGHPAIRVEYQYATETNGGPAVVRGIGTYVLVESRLYIIRYEAEPASFESDLMLYERLLRSVHFEDMQ